MHTFCFRCGTKTRVLINENQRIVIVNADTGRPHAQTCPILESYNNTRMHKQKRTRFI
jgi:hypothetical protein